MAYKMKGFPEHKKTSPLKQVLLGGHQINPITKYNFKKGMEATEEAVKKQMRTNEKKMRVQAVDIVNKRNKTDYNYLDSFKKTSWSLFGIKMPGIGKTDFGKEVSKEYSSLMSGKNIEDSRYIPKDE